MMLEIYEVIWSCLKGDLLAQTNAPIDERYDRNGWLIKKEGGRAPDYVQEGTGHTHRSFGHSMTLNSNTPSQAKADRHPLPKCMR